MNTSNPRQMDILWGKEGFYDAAPQASALARLRHSSILSESRPEHFGRTAIGVAAIAY
jgi:hypothetical protein